MLIKDATLEERINVEINICQTTNTRTKVKIIALKYRLLQIRFHFHPGKFSICYLSGKMKKR